jgi:virulence-associated protein VagC
MDRTGKLFRNGRSQPAQLPADVTLSRQPDSWEDFFELMKAIEVPNDFPSGCNEARPQKRKIF